MAARVTLVRARDRDRLRWHRIRRARAWRALRLQRARHERADVDRRRRRDRRSASGPRPPRSCSSSRSRSISSRAAWTGRAQRHPRPHGSLRRLTPPSSATGRTARAGGPASRSASDMRVRPGETIPLDGRVVAGASDVNQAPITGESLPVDKGPGDEVFAGTINGHGALEVRVTRLGGDTTLGAHHSPGGGGAGRARARRRPSSTASRASTRPSVIALAALVAVVPPLVGWAAVDRLALSRAGAAGDRVSVRAGHLDAGGDRLGAARRPRGTAC